MSPNRVGILLWKEFAHSSKGYLFVFAVLTPVLFSLVVSLLFGTLLSQRPRLGIVDGGNSRIFSRAAESESIAARRFGSIPKLKKAVKTGAVDVGVALPKDFDRKVISGENTRVAAYVWGESLIRNRAMVGAILEKQVREMAGQKPPAEIVAVSLAEGEGVTWEERLFPLLVLMAIFMGGMMVPAASMVDEKQKQTLKALMIIPVSLGDVYLAKGMAGVILSLFAGILILILNNALGAQPSLLVLILALGAIMAATLGVLLGTLIKDINALFAAMKFMGVFLYAPALVYLFPRVPPWIGKFFPTYYVMAPVIEISQKNGGWLDVSLDICILAGVILSMWCAIGIKSKMTGEGESSKGERPKMGPGSLT